MASLKTGELVGLIAADVQEKYTGQFATCAVNCKVNLPKRELEREEAGYRDLPVYYDFGGKKEEILRQNFMRINNEVEAVVNAFRKPIPQVEVRPKGSMKAPGAKKH
jgi:hypothetical protein